MKVQELSVGPIVGWTTPESFRLWGRATKDEEDRFRRWFGVARMRRTGTAAYGAPKFFKLKAIFDFTGIVDFTGLAAEQAYDYEIGYFGADGELKDLPQDMPLDWTGASRGQVTTASDETAQETSFILGSCRYILRTWLGTFFDERGDKTFRSIARQIDKGVKTDLMLMVGDQIYADDLNVIGADMIVEQFFARYRVTFGQDHIRALMARLPTYMTLDDHEIRDDWSQDEFARNLDLYAAAMHAYQSYQLVHGPAFQPTGQHDRSDVPEHLWYRFDSGRAAFFVLDTRTERFRDRTPKQMLSPVQIGALKQWLENVPSERPKFVATSVPMFPDSRSGGADKWAGFDEQRCEILDFIRDKGIARVVFLSGDVHCSMSAQLKCSTHDDFNVTSVVSSSFFWPYPQGQASNFKLSGELTRSGDSVYTVHKTGKVHSADNFTRLTERDGRLRVQVYERKGALLGQRVLEI